MNKNTRNIIKVIIKILKFAASQFMVLLIEDEEEKKKENL